MTTAGRVVPDVPDGPVVPDVPDGPGSTAGGMVVDSTVEEVDVEDEELVVVEAAVLEVGRTVVVGDWVATCCLGARSGPVATSKRRVARATDARAYSPALNR